MSSNRGGKHMAPSKRGGGSQRREELRDRYTYEQSAAGREEFEDVSSYSSSRRKKEDQRELERQRTGKKKGHTAVKAVVALVLVLAALAGAGVYYVQGYLLKDLTVKTITKDREELGIPSEAETVVTDNSIKNIALLGLDSRSSASAGDRSDVMMIITVDNRHGKIKMTSILRDSDVSMRMTTDNGEYYYFDDKITHSFHYGGETLCVQTLNRNFYLNITDYVSVNFEQTAEIVDAVGGIDMELTGGELMSINQNLWSLYVDVENQKEYDYSNGVYDNTYANITRLDFFENIYGVVNNYSSADEYEPGVYHLNGNQAVAYARIRYLDSDNVRATRQQKVLSALLNEVRGKSKLEYPEIIRKIMPMCETSLEFDDIVGMIPILLTNFTIETMSVPGDDDEPVGGKTGTAPYGWCYYYDLEAAARKINDFIYEDDAPAEIKVDEYVSYISEMYRNGTYPRYEGERPEVEEDPQDLPIPVYVPADEPVSSEPGEEPWDEPVSSEPGGEPWDEPVSSEPGEEPWVDPGGEDNPGYEEPEPEGTDGGWGDVDGTGDVTP